MLGKKLWVWVGSPDDRLDVLRYVTATDRDVLAHPAVVKERDGIAAVLVAEQDCRRDAMEKLSASRAEAERLRDVVETYDERFASQHDEHKAEVERLEALVAAKNERLSEADTEVERLRGLLCWVYEHHCSEWALVCDEECEIADLAAEEKP